MYSLFFIGTMQLPANNVRGFSKNTKKERKEKKVALLSRNIEDKLVDVEFIYGDKEKGG